MPRPDFALLALPHLEALHRTALRLSGSRGEADDLVQQTYLEAQRAFATLREPGKCRPWLFGILHNLWAQRRVRALARQSHEARLATESADALTDLEPDVVAAAYSDEVELALRALPGELRAALLLVTVEELTYAEAAQAMSCPIGTVRSRVSRAREQMTLLLASAPTPVRRGRGS